MQHVKVDAECVHSSIDDVLTRVTSRYSAIIDSLKAENDRLERSCKMHEQSARLAAMSARDSRARYLSALIKQEAAAAAVIALEKTVVAEAATLQIESQHHAELRCAAEQSRMQCAMLKSRLEDTEAENSSWKNKLDVESRRANLLREELRGQLFRKLPGKAFDKLLSYCEPDELSQLNLTCHFLHSKCRNYSHRMHNHNASGRASLAFSSDASDRPHSVSLSRDRITKLETPPRAASMRKIDTVDVTTLHRGTPLAAHRREESTKAAAQPATQKGTALTYQQASALMQKTFALEQALAKSKLDTEDLQERMKALETVRSVLQKRTTELEHMVADAQAERDVALNQKNIDRVTINFLADRNAQLEKEVVQMREKLTGTSMTLSRETPPHSDTSAQEIAALKAKIQELSETIKAMSEERGSRDTVPGLPIEYYDFNRDQLLHTLKSTLEAHKASETALKSRITQLVNEVRRLQIEAK